MSDTAARPETFSQRLLEWFDRAGRKNLPWQQNITPYRVWLSEIMLQQTQVNTVIPYFERFTAELPSLQDLADAELDKILHLWTGLGYYSRARNLHAAAQKVCADYQGELPDTVAALSELPGIGRSTAGAIVSIAFKKRAAILDGNVKRVLARYHAVAGWPGQSTVARQLWQYAERYTPELRVADYSQAIMDLGATLCTRSKPACPSCPLSEGCEANKQQRQQDFPGKKPKKTLPVKTTRMLIICNPAGEVLLEKRPASGIWGGLWIFPQLSEQQNSQDYCLDLFGEAAGDLQQLPLHRHSFSHYHLDITATVIQLDKHPRSTMEADQRLWYNIQKPAEIGLAAPIKKMLAQLNIAASQPQENLCHAP